MSFLCSISISLFLSLNETEVCRLSAVDVQSGGVDLHQSVDAGQGFSGHQFPGRQTLELSTEISDGAEVAQTGMVGDRSHRVGVLQSADRGGGRGSLRNLKVFCKISSLRRSDNQR